MATLTPRLFLASLIASSSLLLSACGELQASEPAASAPPPPSVEVAEVLVEQIVETDQYTGRLSSPDTVRVIPRVSGYLEEVAFEEGSLVEEGQVLFRIDSRIFAAEVARLEAELDSANSSLSQARKDYQRAKQLSAQQAISEELLDGRFTSMQRSAASVAAIEASLTRARLDLEFSEVRAPISGRVSNAQVTEGNYVTAGQSELTRLVSTDEIHAYFDVDEQSFLRYQELTTSALGQQVQMALADESGFPHQGEIDFVDNALNQQTGTIRLRANFANPNSQLLPGMFARIQLSGSQPYQSVLIDDKAIGTDLNNKFVLVLDEQQAVQYRLVELGEQVHGLRVIASGLQAGDRIVVNGLQRVRPGMPVTPVDKPMASEQQLQQLRQAQGELVSAASAALAEQQG
ncbi:efflux RND transporter periplasmic adaptor subunit [Aliagarivorans marinus]|uniref:efflux RND transporter periplasmic adaptor subunit n=1 Tax=Aliagarivorans marinus TaxID=561965 RepID=UPI000423DFD1|nr:efflux RND transporter periplasmic adaptor subunit [Aliagarivorans marinus]